MKGEKALVLVSYILFCGNLNLIFAADLANWMTNLPEKVRAVSIKDMAIPGSHDSFTSAIAVGSDLSPDNPDIPRISKSLTRLMVNSVTTKWARTQELDALEQLNAGIRYFDLRFCYNSDKDDIFFCHGKYSFQIDGVISDIDSFLSSHPKEVVILDCQKFFEFSDNTHKRVVDTLMRHLGSKLQPTPSEEHRHFITLDYLAAQNKQVIVVYRDSDTQKKTNELWPSSYFDNPWHNTMDSSTLIEKLDEGLKNRSPDTAYISQCVLTRQKSDDTSGFLKSTSGVPHQKFERRKEGMTPKKYPPVDSHNQLAYFMMEVIKDIFQS